MRTALHRSWREKVNQNGSILSLVSGPAAFGAWLIYMVIAFLVDIFADARLSRLYHTTFGLGYYASVVISALGAALGVMAFFLRVHALVIGRKGGETARLMRGHMAHAVMAALGAGLSLYVFIIMGRAVLGTLLKLNAASP